MPAQSTPAAFLLALRTQLITRYAAASDPTLHTVQVDLVQTGDQSQVDRVLLAAGQIAGSQEYAQFGVRYDQYRCPGQILAYEDGPDSDATFQAAMARAAQILDEIILELQTNRPQVGLQTD